MISVNMTNVWPVLIALQWIVGILIGLAILRSSILFVPQQQLYVIERFGAFHRIAKPGILFKIPLFEQVAHDLSLRIGSLAFALPTNTIDGASIKVLLSVQYHILEECAYDAAYKLHHPAEQIKEYVENVVRAKYPNVTLSEAFAHMSETGDAVRETLGEVMRKYGYEIVAVLVTAIEPDAKVRDAMNRITAAQREQAAASAEGETVRIKLVAQAQAEAQSKKLQGEGIAAQRRAIMDGLGEAAKDLQKAMPESDVMGIMMLTQYFDTLQHLGKPGDRIVFLPASPGGLQTFTNEIRSALMTPALLDEKEE